MATVLTLPRPLSAVVLDLATTRSRYDSLIARLNGREPDEDEDKLWDELDARKAALEGEFRKSFYASTGVDFELAERVMA